jgi:hypothetical protein
MESSSGGEMPALLNATSSDPYASNAAAKAAPTSASAVTSACTNSPPVSAAAFSPAASSMSTATTCAPSAANRRAAASPIPLPAPVITTVLPENRMLSLPFKSIEASQIRSKYRRSSQSVIADRYAASSTRAMFA